MRKSNLLIIYYIISNPSEAHILLTRGIFWGISCLRVESFEAYILLTQGIFFKATARSIVGTPLWTKKVYALVPQGGRLCVEYLRHISCLCVEYFMLTRGIFFKAIARSKATARRWLMYAITSCKLSSYAYVWYSSISCYGEPKEAYAPVATHG